ncbi:MAG: hypothetical protein ACTSUV_06920 [Candidatus Ranarchaeia archaeon]
MTNKHEENPDSEYQVIIDFFKGRGFSSPTNFTWKEMYISIVISAILFISGFLILQFSQIISNIIWVCSAGLLTFALKEKARNGFLKETKTSIRLGIVYYGMIWSLLGTVFLLGGGILVLLFKYALANPGVTTSFLFWGFIGLGLGRIFEFLLGAISEYITFISIFLLVLSGSFYLVLYFGGIQLLNQIGILLANSAIFLILVTVFFILTAVTLQKDLLRIIIPFVKYSEIILHLVLIMWVIISIIGNILFLLDFLMSYQFF